MHPARPGSSEKQRFEAEAHRVVPARQAVKDGFHARLTSEFSHFRRAGHHHPGREGGRLCCVQRPDDEGRAAEVSQQLIGAEPHRPPRRHDDAAHRRVFCVLHPADLPKFPLLFVAELMLSDGSIIADFMIK